MNVRYECAYCQAFTGTRDEVVTHTDNCPVRVPERIGTADVSEIVDGYLAAQLWTQTDFGREDDNTGDPRLDANYTIGDVSDEYRAGIAREIADTFRPYPGIVSRYVARFGGDAEQLGHDFLLTREGHGAGFWDRGAGVIGAVLTELSKRAGGAELLFDDGTGVLR